MGYKGPVRVIPGFFGIFNNSAFLFALIPVVAIWGFRVTYFTRPPETLSAYDHIHGLAMFGWIFILVMQSFLIRTNRRDIHRMMGKLSYLLAPLVIISTLVLANYRLNVRGLTAEGMYLLELQIFILIQFTVFYTMAMRHRKKPTVHARWMICTAFTLLDPILARVILVNFMQVPFESGFIQYMTFGFIDLIVIALVFWDWKSHQRRDVFLPALILLLVTHLCVFVFNGTPAWQSFATWYQSLPIS